MLLSLLLFTLLRLFTFFMVFSFVRLLLLIHNSQNSQEASSSNIPNIVVQSKYKTAVIDNLLPFLIRFIEFCFTIQFNPSVVESIRIQVGEPVFSTILAFIMHDIIVIAYGMDINEGTLAYTAYSRAILQAYRMRLALWTLH